jgi:hypothetical protein
VGIEYPGIFGELVKNRSSPFNNPNFAVTDESSFSGY